MALFESLPLPTITFLHFISWWGWEISICPVARLAMKRQKEAKSIPLCKVTFKNYLAVAWGTPTNLLQDHLQNGWMQEHIKFIFVFQFSFTFSPQHKFSWAAAFSLFCWPSNTLTWHKLGILVAIKSSFLCLCSTSSHFRRYKVLSKV